MKQERLEISALKKVPRKQQKPLLDKNQLKTAGKIIDLVRKKLNSKDYLSSFLLTSQVLENILLPYLIKYLIIRLGIKHNIISEENKLYKLNQIYLSMFQDNKLFGQLERHRKNRNKLIHKITEFTDLKKIDRQAKDYFHECKNVLKEVLYRLNGTKEIPVLTLYPRGWEDFRKAMIKKLDEKEKEIDAEISEMSDKVKIR